MSVFITSDLHFGHRNILKYQGNRPWDTVEAMDEGLFYEWCSKITMDDEVYFLGDLTLTSRMDKTLDIVNRLPAKRIYVCLGNHDIGLRRLSKKGLLPERVEVFGSKPVSRTINDKRVLMWHYPSAEWPGCEYREYSGHGEQNKHKAWEGVWHLHGHSHGKGSDIPGKVDVGWDSYSKILSWEDLSDIMYDLIFRG
jgi:calcineurin-like phosphoesterase family protein